MTMLEHSAVIQAAIEKVSVPQVLAANRLRELAIPEELIATASLAPAGSEAFDAVVQAMVDWAGANWTKGPDGIIRGPDGKELPTQ